MPCLRKSKLWLGDSHTPIQLDPGILEPCSKQLTLPLRLCLHLPFILVWPIQIHGFWRGSCLEDILKRQAGEADAKTCNFSRIGYTYPHLLLWDPIWQCLWLSDSAQFAQLGFPPLHFWVSANLSVSACRLQSLGSGVPGHTMCSGWMRAWAAVACCPATMTTA